MARGNAIRGSRIGAGPMGEAERGEVAPRRRVSFWCANGHESRPSFAAEADIPEQWECPRCGNPTSRDKDNPPEPPKVEPYKTHLAYVRERRDDQDGEALLNEALETLRKDS
jgi:rubredoxin